MIWARKPHESGESFEIKQIDFRNLIGEHEEIVSAIHAIAGKHQARKLIVFKLKNNESYLRFWTLTRIIN